MMADLSTILTHLGRTQSRRKGGVLLASLLLTPIVFFVAPASGGGSWAHALIAGAGVLAVVVAVLGRSWCTLYIGNRKVRELVSAGPFSVVRNPLYVFSFVGVGGLAAQTGSLSVTIIVIVIAYALFLPVVRKEEQALLQLHGLRYDIYRRHVPRFWPKLSLWRDLDTMEVSPGRWRTTVLDGMVMICLVPVVRGISWIQAAMPDLPLLRLP